MKISMPEFTDSFFDVQLIGQGRLPEFCLRPKTKASGGVKAALPSRDRR